MGKLPQDGERTPRSPLWRLTLIAGLTGLAIQIAMPPLCVWWLPFVLWVPLLLELWAAPLWRAAYAGFVAGAGAFSGMPLALLPWGPVLYLGSVAISAGIFAGLFVCTALLWRRFDRRFSWLAFPCAWLCAYVAANHVMEWPLAFSLTLVLPVTPLTEITRVIGTTGLEFLIALSSASIAAHRMRHISLRSLALLQVLILSCLLAGPQLAIPESSGHVRVAAIQPSVEFSNAKAAQWSLPTRRGLERRIDELTRRALEGDAAMVLMPEGGNDLFNTRLARRKAKLAEMMEEKNAGLLVSGRDLTPEGDLYNVVSLYRDGAFRGSARKSHTVLSSESNLSRGEPAVFRLAGFEVGLSICFDAIFESHAYALAARGADLLAVVSDDSSFGLSVLETWHLPFALLRGIEVGRPVALVVNNGPSMATDPRGRLLHADWSGKRPGVYRWTLPTSSTTTPSAAGGRFAIFGLLAVLVPLALRGQTRGTGAAVRTAPGCRPRFRGAAAARAVACLLLVAFLNAGGMLSITSFRYGTSPAAVLRDARSRYLGEGVQDGIAPLFRQPDARSCGAAALAYVLTQLGDPVFALAIVDWRPPPDKGYSFAEMATFAAARGFRARGFAAGYDDLPRSGQPPVVAHLRRGHYVVVIHAQRDEVLYFDPAIGRTVHADREDFMDRWSGRILVVSTV